MNSVRLLVVIVISVSSLGGLATAADDVGKQADAFIRRGVELRQAGSDDAAAVEFRKAYDLGATPRAAAQLGLAEQALGRWEDAESHLTEALRGGKDPWIVKHQKTLLDALSNIKGHVGRVEVIGEPEGAEVYVNGRLAGKVPLSAPVHVSAGEVFIELRARGYARASRPVTIAGGQFQSVVVRMERDVAPPPPFAKTAGVGTSGTSGGTAAPPGALTAGPARPQLGVAAVPTAVVAAGGDDDPGPPVRLREVAKWTAFGLGVGGLVLGTAASFVRIEKKSEFDSASGMSCGDYGGTAKHTDGTLAPECQTSLNAFHTARTWQVIGFLGAGAFVVTWLALMLTEPGTPPEAARSAAQAKTLDWGCTTTLSHAGVACQMRF